MSLRKQETPAANKPRLDSQGSSRCSIFPAHWTDATLQIVPRYRLTGPGGHELVASKANESRAPRIVILRIRVLPRVLSGGSDSAHTNGQHGTHRRPDSTLETRCGRAVTTTFLVSLVLSPTICRALSPRTLDPAPYPQWRGTPHARHPTQSDRNRPHHRFVAPPATAVILPNEPNVAPLRIVHQPFCRANPISPRRTTTTRPPCQRFSTTCTPSPPVDFLEKFGICW
jgi:hypothetical protein